MIPAADFEKQAQALAARDPQFIWVNVASIGRRSMTGYLYTKNTQAAEPLAPRRPTAAEALVIEELNALLEDHDAAAVSTAKITVFYNFHIVYSTAYSVPELLFQATLADGQPLDRDAVIQLLPEHQRISVTDSPDTILTFKEHPLLQIPFFGIHPCRTREVLALIRESAGRDPNSPPYLYSWLSIVGQLLPIPQPLWVRKYPIYVSKTNGTHGPPIVPPSHSPTSPAAVVAAVLAAPLPSSHPPALSPHPPVLSSHPPALSSHPPEMLAANGKLTNGHLNHEEDASEHQPLLH